MKKRGVVYIFAVVFGLVATLFIFWNTARTDTEYKDANNLLCNGLDIAGTMNYDNNVVDATTVDRGGAPFKFEKVTPIKINPCVSEANINTFSVSMDLTREYVWSLPFLANWLILSLPFLGGAYLYTKKRENTRH